MRLAQLAAEAEKKALRQAKRDAEKSVAKAKKALFIARDERGRTPLHMATTESSVMAARAILEHDEASLHDIHTTAEPVGGYRKRIAI